MMTKTRIVRVLLCSTAALACAAPAAASEIVTRNATRVRLATDDGGRAMVTYRQRGRTWHTFVWGAVNARQPSRTVKQVNFKVDYSGGRGEWKRFKNTCQTYDGPSLAWAVAACKATEGSYWALQTFQRMLPNVGYTPWRAEQRAWEMRISHWTGEIAQLEVYTDWVYGGRFHEVFGRATYHGEAVHGFKTTPSGVPLDSYGRLLYLDTFDSAYGPGWRRENSFVAHNPSGMFCYGFYPRSSYDGYPKQRTKALSGKGKRYRITLGGPGVTPDVVWVGDGLGDYDKDDAELVDHEKQMNDKLDQMRASYGEKGCVHH